MSIKTIIEQAQEHMQASGIDGWLLYDYRHVNPIFWDTVGQMSNVTRPCWLWVPCRGEASLLVSFVDQGRFARLGISMGLFINREDMLGKLRRLLAGSSRVAMEYSPQGELPRISRVDAGTLEMVRGLGVRIESSADLVQYATQRWSESQLGSHLVAAEKLGLIVKQAYSFIGENLSSGPTEFDVAELIRRRFAEEGLETPDGPIVAANEHSSDPHFEPDPDTSRAITRGDWVLIDLWARLTGRDTMFADITWTAFVGDEAPPPNKRVFEAVIGARDAALAKIEQAFRSGRPLHGWEVDKVARDYIHKTGFGAYFNHRLGHSLGREVHGNAVNLDGWESRDTRLVIPGVAVTIEPGIYLPEFGVRSEIDVFIEEEGPRVTTEVQRSVVLIQG